MQIKSSKDPFHFHKVALRPLLRGLDKQETTALQDNLKDVLNAVSTLQQEKQKASTTMQAMEQLD